MFIVGGFNAYPAEIENLLLRHPRIAQVAVIGVPDERLGEVGKAFVVVGTGRDARARGDHRVGARRDGELQGAARGRVRRRAAGERDRQGREGRAARRAASREWRRSRGHPLLPEQLELRRSDGRTASTISARGRSTISTTRSAGGASPTPPCGRAGSTCAGPVTTTVRWRPGSRWRSSPVSSDGVAADSPFFGPVVAADLARHAGLELEDAHTSVVLDAPLLDFAVARRRDRRRRRGRLRGRDPGFVLTDDVARRPPPRGAARRAGSRDRPHPRGRAGDVARRAPDDADGVALGDAALARSRALGLAITVADLVGTMEGVLGTTTDYAKERQQYGVPIGSFQAVQHLLAEAQVLRGGFDQRRAVRGVGGRRARGGRGRSKRRGRRRPTAPVRPARCARPRSRCTAASATPGSASCTCTCAARCSPARCSATRATTCARSRSTTRDERGG